MKPVDPAIYISIAKTDKVIVPLLYLLLNSFWQQLPFSLILFLLCSLSELTISYLFSD